MAGSWTNSANKSVLEKEGGTAVNAELLKKAKYNQGRYQKYLQEEFKKTIKMQKECTRSILKEIRGQNIVQVFEQLQEARETECELLGPKL